MNSITETRNHRGTFSIIIFLMFFVSSVSALKAQTCNNTYPTTDNLSIHTAIAPKPITIGGNINCPDVALQLRYDNELPYYGILALTTTGNDTLYSTLSDTLDFILSAIEAQDLILNTLDSTGRIRFATSEKSGSEGTPEDIERMTIMPNGKIGIGNNTPDNLFTVRKPIGIDFYNNDEGFQDFRFNCYQTVGSAKEVSKVDSTTNKDGLKLPLTPGYVNIQSGFTGIIQMRNTLGWGSMLLAVDKSNQNPNTDNDFFEHSTLGGSMPKGIMIQNFLDIDTNDYATIGIGAMPNPLSRLTLQGMNTDTTMNCFHIISYDGEDILNVRNDGLLALGTKVFNPDTNNVDIDEEMKLSVDGAIVAKEILVENSTLKWSDFVFESNYDLMSITELEESIKTNGKLPDIPSAKEINEKGLNLAQMDAKLLRKIEELTLYVIQLNKDNEELREEIQILKSKR